jgi:hypothetical protein
MRHTVDYLYAIIAGEIQDDTVDLTPECIELAAELRALEREERKLSAQRRMLHLRLSSFTNEQTAARERGISAQRRVLHERIDSLYAQLAILGWDHIPSDE